MPVTERFRSSPRLCSKQNIQPRRNWWEDVTKYDWGWGFTFADQTIAEKICTDSNVGAKVRTKDDGTERCREDVCWFNRSCHHPKRLRRQGKGSIRRHTLVSTQTGRKAITAATAFAFSGRGTSDPVQESKTQITGRGPMASKPPKSSKLCAPPRLRTGLISTLVAFSAKASWIAKVKCNAKYCNIVGKNTYVDNATCTVSAVCARPKVWAAVDAANQANQK